MLGRDWLQHLTVGRVAGVGIALGIAAFAWIGLQPDPPKVPEYQQLEKLDGPYKPDDGSCAPQRLARMGDASERLTKAEECAKAAEDHRIEQQALTQAARVTNATEEGLWLTYQGARTNVASTILLFLTLAATAWAAYAASEATRVAKRSEKDSEESLRLAGLATAAAERAATGANRTAEIMAENAERELRAYVTVSMHGVQSLGGQQPHVIVLFENHGRTPAYQIDMAGRFDIYPVDEYVYKDTTSMMSKGGAADLTLGMSRPERFQFDQSPFSEEDVAAVFAGTKEIVARGRVRYFDVYQKERWTYFCHKYGGPKLAGHYHTEGNRST